MAQGSNRGGDLIATIVTIVGTIAATGLGAWVFRLLQFRADWSVRRGEAQEKHERTIIAEYQKILDDKDNDLKESRDDWVKQRDILTREAAGLRRTNQAYMLDMEGGHILVQRDGIDVLAHAYREDVHQERI
jgi:hypothetical protein